MQIEAEDDYKQYCREWHTKEEGFNTKAVTNGKIEFRNFRAKYRGDLPDVLKGVNLTIAEGEKIGIVGRTGAGKTSLINSLLRLTEIAGGEILIAGRAIRDYPLKDLRRAVTLVDQEPTLITSTFR